MRRSSNRKARLGVEHLEQRAVQSTAVLANGVLTITGTHYSDYIDVRQVYSFGEDRIYVRNTQISVGGASVPSVPAQSVASIHVYGHNGSDIIRFDSERLAGHQAIVKPTLVRAGYGNDLVIGGQGRDRLDGWMGDDKLLGRKGMDVLVGGDGRDTLSGGNHNDELYGGAGRDLLGGGAGSDWLWGGDGNDFLSGGDGIDFAWGGTGRDTFRNLVDLSSGVGFFSPTTNQYAKYSGIQDYNFWEGDRIL